MYLCVYLYMYTGLTCLSCIFGGDCFPIQNNKNSINQSSMVNLLKTAFLWLYNYLLQLKKIITALFNLLT